MKTAGKRVGISRRGKFEPCTKIRQKAANFEPGTDLRRTTPRDFRGWLAGERWYWRVPCHPECNSRPWSKAFTNSVPFQVSEQIALANWLQVRMVSGNLMTLRVIDRSPANAETAAKSSETQTREALYPKLRFELTVRQR
ncbi:hypothetical protein SBA3_620015 [Candidatus Sulfopaludibacter sp. SbA3]|nr:hypothetical protein SBA3_620015 [Candidatus Sulfopaludibacter sp. SbA3]